MSNGSAPSGGKAGWIIAGLVIGFVVRYILDTQETKPVAERGSYAEYSEGNNAPTAASPEVQPSPSPGISSPGVHPRQESEPLQSGSLKIEMDQPQVSKSEIALRCLYAGEAISGSLSNLEAQASAPGGITGNSRSQFGNAVENEKGHVAITWLEEAGNQSQVVLARCLNGQQWDRVNVDSIADNELGRIGNVLSIRTSFTGVGPLVQIDPDGRVLFTHLEKNLLLFSVWEPGQALPTSITAKATGRPALRCGKLYLEKIVKDYSTYCFGGNFFLLTSGANLNQVYKLVGSDWQLNGTVLEGTAGMLSFDSTTKELFIGVSAIKKPKSNFASNVYPAVFRYSERESGWQELVGPASGLKPAFGVCSYVGAADIAPAVIAHNGLVYCYWVQEQLSGYSRPVIQGAVFREGAWNSCGRRPADAQGSSREVESFGAGGMIGSVTGNFTPCRQLFAFDLQHGAHVLIHGGYYFTGFLVKDGRTTPLELRAANTENGSQKFGVMGIDRNAVWHLVGNSSLGPHCFAVSQGQSSLILQATLSAGTNSDVFIFRLTPNTER